MVITNFGKSGLALQIVSSGLKPNFLFLGTGSAAEVPTLGSLITQTLGSGVPPTSVDLTTNQQVFWTFDVSSVAMSGNTITELGMAPSSGTGNNDLWNREGFAGILFNGNNELQVQLTYKTF